jgi:hypothetical protein
MQYINTQTPALTILPVNKGGTNLTSVGASGNVLTSDGLVWVSAPPTIPVLTGDVSSVTNVVTLNNTSVTGQFLTGFTVGGGVVTENDTILHAIEKIAGNVSSVSSIGGVLTINEVTNLATFSGSVQINEELEVHGVVNTDITTSTILKSFSSTTYRSGKFILQVNCTLGTDSGSYQTSEVLVVHDGTTAYLTEYGIVQTGNSLVDYTASIVAGNVKLAAQATSDNTISVRTISSLIIV